MTQSAAFAPQSELTLEQAIVLYPSFAYHVARSDHWSALVSGLAFQPSQDGMRQRVFLKLLRRVLQVDADELNDNEVFQSRVGGFLVDPQRAVRVAVRLGSHDGFMLRRSRRNGHFRGHDEFSSEEIAQLTAPDGDDATCAHLPCRVLLPEQDSRNFDTQIPVIGRAGVSVISDIDDTIKISQVAHRKQLLHNTFLHPFATVPGMAEVFAGWAAAGAKFHYVSSSPWQLYGPLKTLLDGAGFPCGSFHLRTIRFGDPSIVRLFVSRKRNKYHVIRTLFRLFPQRKFILVGDSGERDAEIYGAIARKFPDQVLRILIRRVEGRKWTRNRVAKAFHRVPREAWQTFRSPDKIKPIDWPSSEQS